MNKSKTELEGWLKKNYRQRFSVGHPANYIMPPIEYCLYAVKENMQMSGNTSITEFINSFKFCMTDIVSAISKAAAYLADEYIPSLAKELSGAKKVEATA